MIAVRYVAGGDNGPAVEGSRDDRQRDGDGGHRDDRQGDGDGGHRDDRHEEDA